MLLLKPPQMVRLLGSQPLKHPPAAATFGFLRSIRVKRIAAAFDGERELERVADDGGLQAPLLVGGVEFPLLPEAGLTDAEDHVAAVPLIELVFIGHLPDEIFDSPRGELDGVSANVAYEMKMVGLLDERLISRHPLDLGLADESRLKQDFQRPINRGQPDPVPFFQKLIAYFFDRRMALRTQQCLPDKRALGCPFQLPVRQQLLQLFPMYHRGQIIRYSNGL